MINIADIIGAVCTDSFAPMVERVFQKQGVAALFRVINVVQRVFRELEPAHIRGSLIVYTSVRPIPNRNPNERSLDYAALNRDAVDELVIEVDDSDTPYIKEPSPGNIATLASSCIVYQYINGIETFYAGTESKAVLRYDPAALSQFSIPTFRALQDALQRYATDSVFASTCYILRKIWYDQNRLYLKAKPEAQMRDSLVQYLRNRMGSSHDIYPEHMVNESEPVDVCVQPKMCNNRMMLIEIKWLGDSVDDNGNRTANHRDSRARQGATQLAHYIDCQRQTAPGKAVRGYYVIIDARRKGLMYPASLSHSISSSDGFFYEYTNISFSPDYSSTRSDFEYPFRMFASPICHG